jgi:hypothetical protein
MSKSGIKIQAFSMKSKSDILIFQGESVGGHENAGKSKTLDNTWAPEMSGIPKSVFGINFCFFDFTLLGFLVKSCDRHWIRFEKTV